MSKSSPELSVIIPHFEDHERLALCLGCLEQQSLPSSLFEVIVIDNGSERLPNLKHDLIELVLDSCATPSSYAARNAGLLKARGKYVAFTDSDCLPEKNWLKNILKRCQSEGEDFVLGGKIEVEIQDPNSPIERYESLLAFDQQFYISKRHFCVTANFAAARQAFIKVGLFNENLRSGGDREWCHRAAKSNLKILYAPEIIIKHPARRNLSELLQKARRVRGGEYFENKCVTKKRFLLDYFVPTPPICTRHFAILFDPKTSLGLKFKLLWLGILIWLTKYVEGVRLALGKAAERC